MAQLRPVSKTEKILFPILVTLVTALIVPPATTLIGMLMLGNLLKESLVVERLKETVAGAMMNIVILLLGLAVGASATADKFLTPRTLLIIGLGLFAFAVGTASGVLLAKLMNFFSGGKVNPLIGSAGVDAIPMSARVSQKLGQQADPSNFLLMHAMGPNVAGAIAAATVAGVMMALFGG
jgi:carboxybiotin decarboxylase